MKRTTEHIRDYIAEGQLGQAAKMLVVHCRSYAREHRDEAILLSQRFHTLEKEIHIRGIISPVDALREQNSIAYGMLCLLQVLDDNNLGEAA